MEQTHESITKRILHLNSLLSRSVSDSQTDSNFYLISREALIDALILLYDECNNEFLMKDSLISDFVEKYRNTIHKLRDLNPNIGDFEIKKVISRGRYAEVSVAKEKSSQNVCVLKKIRKSDILNVAERIQFENERNLLIAASRDCEARKWIPCLYYSFQNMKYLYYVLEYCPGGNLCTMLEYYKKNVPEPMLRFYLSEMIQAIHSVHAIGFVHRDIRPENILIDKIGHVKLVDFGSSAKLSRLGQVTSKMICSIPHYTAPEIFKFQESPSTKGYTAHCDWWSLGIVLFELICGNVPFTSDEVSKLHLSPSTYSRKLQYPKQVNISQDLKNIISGLLQPVERRLGYEKLTNLEYFNDIAWVCLKERDPPFVPSLNSADDTSYFTTYEIQRPTPKVEDFKIQRRFTGRNLPFLGFTYMGSDVSDLDSSNSTNSYILSKFPASISGRRQTENYPTAKENEDFPRHSTGSFPDNKMQSECSDESYQSASVRLQNEVTQLHLFYNEKALIIEESLRNKFHDMYNCITEEQSKLLLDKQLMMKEFKDKEDKMMKENNELKAQNKILQNELNAFMTKCAQMENQQEDLSSQLEETIEKLKKNEKLKKETVAKLNQDIQKLQKDLTDRNEKLKEAEEKMLNLSNQQAAKLAMLSKTRTTLRSRSTERDKFEQENVSLKNQLIEANKKIVKLSQELEKKGKMKFDLEFKMTTPSKKESSDKSKGDASSVMDSSMEQIMKDKIEKLNAEVQRQQKEISALQEKVKKEKDLKQKEIVELKNKLNDELEKKRKEITEFQGTLSKKQELKQKEIDHLQNELDKELQIKQKQIFDLQDKLNEEQKRKQNEIADLQEKLDHGQREKQQEIANLQNKLAEEQKRIQKEISELQEKFSREQNQKLKDLTLLHEKVNEELGLQQEENFVLREKLCEEQNRRQKEVAELREKLDQELCKKQKEISDLKDKFDYEQNQKQKEIVALQAKFAKEIDRKQEEISDLKDKLSQEENRRQKEIAELQKKSKTELERKLKEISDLQNKLTQEQNRKRDEIDNLRVKKDKETERKEKEISDLQTKLTQEQALKLKEISALQEKLDKDLNRKQKEISELQTKLTQEQAKKEKEIAASLEKLNKQLDLKQKEIAEIQDRLNKELDKKQKEISDLQNKLNQEQKKRQNDTNKNLSRKPDKTINVESNRVAELESEIAKINEDLFANLVTIEDLKTALEEKENILKQREDEISNLKKELEQKSLEVSSVRVSLCKSDEEKEKLETKIEALLNEIKSCNEIKLKEIEATRFDPNEVVKQVETVMREILNENLQKKENSFKASDFEKMFNTLQKRVSYVCSTAEATKSGVAIDPEMKNVIVLEDQVKRLESQLDKQRETAILQREAAAQAKKELAAAEKELSNLRIDLRIAQREAKTAEEEIKKLQKSKYVYYKELKEEKENLELKLKEEQQKVQELELEVQNLKTFLDSKEKEIKEKESESQDRLSTIETLQKELKSLKNENHNLKKEKKSVDESLKEKETDIKQLKNKINKMKEKMKQHESSSAEVIEEMEKLKTKCASLENTNTSLKETCLMLDKQVENFETYNQELEEKLKSHLEEKLELQKEIERLNDEFKNAKKMFNEEKSLKVFAENKIRLLEIDLEKKDNELKSLESYCVAKDEEILGLKEQIDKLEENSDCADILVEKIRALKMERSEYLTEIQKKTDIQKKLEVELNQLQKDHSNLLADYGDLQSALDHYKVNQWKYEETLQQLSKAMDHVLSKDATKHKRTLADKLFRSKGKENLNPKELENLLYSERKKCKELAEQLYEAQIGLRMLRGENISKCSSPKTISDFESYSTRTTSHGNHLTSISNLSESPLSRVKHNIPHKFETKKCTKSGYRCSVCNEPISFMNTSYCKECHIWSHLSCANKIEPNCGLPSALREYMMTKSSKQLTSSESSLKSEIEGDIMVLRDGIWEKMRVCFENKNLVFSSKMLPSSEPVMKIPFSSVRNIDDNVDVNSILTMSSSYDGEASCIIKIIYRENDIQKSLYLRASSVDDKVNWLNIMKRNITIKQISFKLTPEESFKGNVVFSFDKTNRLRVNQVIQIEDELCLIAAKEGLYSLKINNEVEKSRVCNPVKISGVEEVSKVKILTKVPSKLPISLMICGKENSLKKCDLRMLVSNAQAAECSSPFITLENASTRYDFQNCAVLEASRCNSLISFTFTEENSEFADKYLIVLEWNEKGFDICKFKKKVSDIKCMLFTSLTNILYCTSNEFYRIDLSNMNETRLSVFKYKTEVDAKLCEAQAIIKINDNLFLLCDKLFGVFINANGKRIKSAETMKWPLALKGIVYNKPFLCVSHNDCVSLVYLPSHNENSEKKFKFSTVDFINPTILGVIKQSPKGIYIKEENEDTCKLYFLDTISFMNRNPKPSWSSISTHSGETTDEECIQQSLNISSETDLSLNSSILESSTEL